MSSNDIIPFRKSPDYRGSTVLALNASLIGFTTVVIALRLYVRTSMSKTLGIDDGIAVTAYVCLVVQSAFDIRSVNFGSGAHVMYVPQELIALFFSALVNNTLLYFIGTGLMRLSIVAFLPRLGKDLNSPIFMKIVYAVGLIVIVQTLGCFFYRLTECTPIKDIWEVPTKPGLNCVSPQQEQNNLIAHQAIGIFVDFALFALPIWVINAKMIFSTKKIQVILVFSVGIFVVATGIVRMVMLNTLLFLEDPTFSMSTIGPWTDLEGHAGLWCASFPALQPLVRLVSFKLGFRSKILSYGGTHKSDNVSGHANRFGGNSNWATSASRNKSGYARNGSGIDDESSERGIVLSANKGVIEMDNFGALPGNIHKKMEFDVRVEDRQTGKDSTHGGTSKSWVGV